MRDRRQLTWWTKTSRGGSTGLPSLLVIEINPKPIRTLNHLQKPDPDRIWGRVRSSCSADLAGSSSAPPLAGPPDRERRKEEQGRNEREEKEGWCKWRKRKRGGGGGRDTRIKLRHIFFLEDTSVRAALSFFFGGGDLQAAWGPSEGGFHSQTRAM